ncbi:MAG: hypothetical protein ABL856_01595 [Gallionella sp.]
MSKFSASLDIWALDEKQVAALRVGQWVFAGDKTNRGLFLGVKKSGSVVVAWLHNAKNSSCGYNTYVRNLRQYAIN